MDEQREKTVIKHTMIACMMAVGGLARAHSLWIEPVALGVEAKAYFGEWADDVRETEAGYLKLVTAPRGMAADGALLPVTRHDDHLSFRPVESGDARLAAGYVNDKGVMSLYQAKAGRTETSPCHPLELVPIAAGSNTFTLLLAGRPLAKKEVVLFGPPKWQKSFRTDEAGRVTFATPWTGQYVAEVGYLDKDASGSWDGKVYTQTRHVSTLTFVAP